MRRWFRSVLREQDRVFTRDTSDRIKKGKEVACDLCDRDLDPLREDVNNEHGG